jgi:hypothetical protein
MKKLTQAKTLNGQILIIVMLVLAMISILLVVISRNVRKDATEQIQSEQYEEYYTAVEEELLNIINGSNDTCNIETATETTPCIIPLNKLYKASALNDPKLYVSKNDLIEFRNLVVGKDKSVTIDLDSYDDNLTFSWKGTVAWVVNIDYLGANGQYKTSESIYDNNTPPIFPNSPDFDNCIDFIEIPANPNSFSFNISDCITSLTASLPDPSYTTLSVRMKPIMLSPGTTELTLTDADLGLPAQARIILATGDIDDDLNDSPTIQLELLTPLHRPSLEILDYALRTENRIEKPY